MDLYTGDPAQAASIRDQINGLKFSLDGIDPSTGKKVKAGLNDQRDQLRSTLQNYGDKIKPGAVLTPSSADPTKYDFINEPENDGLENPDDPLYKTNVQPQQQQQIQPQAQGQQTGQGGQGGQQATTAMIFQLGQAIAQQLGTSISDPAVKQAVRQHLSQQGISIPTIQ